MPETFFALFVYSQVVGSLRKAIHEALNIDRNYISTFFVCFNKRASFTRKCNVGLRLSI